MQPSKPQPFRLPQRFDSPTLAKYAIPGEPTVIVRAVGVGSTAPFEYSDRNGRQAIFRYEREYDAHVLKVPASVWNHNKGFMAHELMDQRRLPHPLVVTVDIPTAEATSPIKELIDAMKADPEYAWGWHCNLVMAMEDAGAGTLQDCNKGAALFMSRLTNGAVDTTQHPDIKAAVSELLSKSQDGQEAKSSTVNPIKDAIQEQGAGEAVSPNQETQNKKLVLKIQKNIHIPKVRIQSSGSVAVSSQNGQAESSESNGSEKCQPGDDRGGNSQMRSAVRQLPCDHALRGGLPIQSLNQEASSGGSIPPPDTTFEQPQEGTAYQVLTDSPEMDAPGNSKEVSDVVVGQVSEQPGASSPFSPDGSETDMPTGNAPAPLYSRAWDMLESPMRLKELAAVLETDPDTLKASIQEPLSAVELGHAGWVKRREPQA